MNSVLRFGFQELIDELKIYFLFFDRAGYGDSDPNPKRSVKSEAYDVQELADKLQIGSKFYVIGISMGAYPIYSCLKYIPHRHVAQFAYKLQASYVFLPLALQHFCFVIFSYVFLSTYRLAGASLVVPFVHYWWPCLPANISNEAFNRLLPQDQWSFRVAHYTPWLFYWWMTQKWFPSLSIVAGNMAIFSQSDLEILKKCSEAPSVGQVVNFIDLS